MVPTIRLHGESRPKKQLIFVLSLVLLRLLLLVLLRLLLLLLLFLLLFRRLRFSPSSCASRRVST